MHVASVAVASAILLATFLPAAHAQTKQPEKPEDFKAMEAPGRAAPLTTAPGASLITPATGPVNPQPGFSGSKMVMTQAVFETSTWAPVCVTCASEIDVAMAHW